MIYLDHNATTPTHPGVLEAMIPYFSESFYNPSSMYQNAHHNREVIEKSREIIASFLNAKPDEIIFTSGGTESDNFAIKGVAYSNRNKGNHIITSTIEHPAVLNTCKYLEKQGFLVDYIPVDEYGIIDLDALEEAIREDTILITIMHANNEVGSIQPLSEIGAITRSKGIYFHTDAVQSVGKIPVNVEELGVDLLALSGHKLYGPKGVGVLYIRSGTKITPLIHGGSQESDIRAGTENVPSIIGLGKACEIAQNGLKENASRLRELSDYFWKGISGNIEDVFVNGHPDKRLPGTLNVCFKYAEGEAVLLNLDVLGIAASSGSACSSGENEPSHVLLALDICPALAQCSVRFSLGNDNTCKEIDKVVEVLPGIVKRLRDMSPIDIDPEKCG
ncbi:cysteine desulfurase NifS [bacterium]|nr:cysteine desulfurase NifS [bacterium]